GEAKRQDRSEPTEKAERTQHGHEATENLQCNVAGEHVREQRNGVGDRPGKKRQHFDERHQRQNVDRDSTWHEQLEEAQSVFPKAINYDREKDEQSKGYRNDDVAGDRKSIGNNAHHVQYQDEHEERKYQREEFHALGAGGTSQRVGDEFVGDLRDRLETSRNHGAAAGGTKHQQQDQEEPDQHEQCRIGKGDFHPANMSDRKKLFDLKLVDRIHEHPSPYRQSRKRWFL